MSNWNDDRLDQFERHVDERFDMVDRRLDKVDERFERFEGRVDNRLNRIEERLAATPTRKEVNDGFAEIRVAVLGLHRTLYVGAIAIVVALIGVIGVLLA